MLDTLGNIGDFLGGIGVIITLLYLAVQIRQNTRSSRTESYQAVVAAVSEFTREVGLSPDGSRILMAGLADFESLPPEDKMRFNLMMTSVVRNLENIHYQFSHGAIEESTWQGWAVRIHSFLEPPGARAWWHTQELAYSSDFRRFVNEQKPAVMVPDVL